MITQKRNQLEQFVSHGQALFEGRDFEASYQQLSLAVFLLEEEGALEWLGEEEGAKVYLLRGSALLHEHGDQAYHDPDLFQQVLEDFETAIDLQPDQSTYYVLRGRLFLNCKYANYLFEAKSDFSQALGLQPNDLTALKLMGDVLSRLGEYDRAIYYLSRVLEAQPDKEVYLLRGLSYFRQSAPDLAAAAADFGQAQQWFPRLEELYLWRAQCFQELGETQAALEEYDRLLSFSTQKAGYYIDRGVIRAASDPQGALDDYSKALALEAHPLAFNNRAVMLRQQGNYEAAIADAQAALATDPTYSIAYATLAEIYAEIEERSAMYHYPQLAVKHYYEDPMRLLEEPVFKPYHQDEEFRVLLMPQK
ncbi:MAG: tetratricopeptide repeat protein [Bacteroidota bacterium]